MKNPKQNKTNDANEIITKGQKREQKKRNKTKMKVQGASVKKLQKLLYL
jgi:hypothetical protein